MHARGRHACAAARRIFRSCRRRRRRQRRPPRRRSRRRAPSGDEEPKDPGEAAAESDFDEDDMENSLSLAAIEAELKPKVVETFDTIADDLQAAAPPAGPGHRIPPEEQLAVAGAGAQVQEAQGRDHRRGEVAAAQPGAHRRAGRAALRHQQAPRVATKAG